MNKISQLIKTSFIFLFLATPLIFNFSNSELFELPKMYFVYLMTIIITTLHLINWSLGNISLFKKNFLNFPILIFLVSQIVSTFISIDPHTSFFGYYSRLNGGLLSLLAYTSLYFVLSNYIDLKFKQKIINSILISGFLVSIYGIAEHFGIDKNMWVQDVQSRVFSTLGQPNWLAAFLVIIIPFSIDKFFKSNQYGRIAIRPYLYLFLTMVFYTTLLFTKSKSGIIACIFSLFIYFLFSFFKNPLSLRDISLKKGNFKKASIFKGGSSAIAEQVGLIIILIVLSLLISNPIKDKFFSKKSNTSTTDRQTQNLNITPSEDIRKIVWRGAFDLWKQYPLFGTGVETFAYSYYWTRPVEHNLTSEWEFLYNKAHNEYLNFLATTGIVGFVAYLFLITTILIKTFNNKSIFCTILALLITNLVGFSVVTTSLLLFLLPTLVLDYKPSTKKLKSKKYLIIPVLLVFLYLISQNINFYLADIFYAKSMSFDQNSNYQTAYRLISKSLNLRPNEPEYLTQSALLESKLTIITKKTDYIDTAINHINQAIKISPANTGIWKQRAQIFYYLSSIDKQYFQESINSLFQIITLAPTDAKNFYTIGQFLESANLIDQSIPYYQKAIELKSNYDHAYFALGQIYFSQKKYDLAKQNLELTLRYNPLSSEAQQILQKISTK